MERSGGKRRLRKIDAFKLSLLALILTGAAASEKTPLSEREMIESPKPNATLPTPTGTPLSEIIPTEVINRNTATSTKLPPQKTISSLQIESVKFKNRLIINTETPTPEKTEPEFIKYYDDIPSLANFIKEVSGGAGNQLKGVWAEGLFAIRVGGISNSAPDNRNTASIYQKAKNNGGNVLLIHNSLGGSRLYQMDGRPVYIVYPNSSPQIVHLTGGYWYEQSGKNYYPWGCLDCTPKSSQDIFNTHYTGRAGLVIQTTIRTEESKGILILEFN